MHLHALLLLPLLTAALLAQGEPEAAEPNDSPATATVLPPGEQAIGAISAGDEDWWKITVAAASDYNVWTGPGIGAQIGDTRVRILAADGVTVLVDVDDGNVATHGFYTTLQGNLQPGDYYVAVRGFNSTTTGSYALDVVLAPQGTYVELLTPVAEAAEDNDPRNSGGVATVSAIGTRNAGTISSATAGTGFQDPGADYDFFRVDVPAAGTLTMATLPDAAAPAMADTVVFLADAGFALLALDDDGGPGLLSLLAQPVTPGTYYVVVKGWDTGNYALAVTMGSSLPVGAASVTIQPGGCAGVNGTPRLQTRLSSTGNNVRPEVPILGATFYVDGDTLPPAALLFRVIGLVPRATPFPLTLLGAPGCQVEVDPLDTIPSLSDLNGMHYWGLASPPDVWFLGLPIEQQLIALDRSANRLGLITSNRLSSVFGVTH